MEPIDLYKFKTDEEKQEACIIRKDEIVKGIAKALKDAGVECSLRKRKNQLSYGADPLHWIDLNQDQSHVRIDVNQEFRFGRWNGKLRVVVGNIRGKKQFPERKNGFDYAAIAEAVKAFIVQDQQWYARRNQDDLNTEAAAEIEARLKADYPDLFADWNSGIRLENKHKPDNFEIKLVGLNEEEIRKLVPLLQAAKRSEKE